MKFYTSKSFQFTVFFLPVANVRLWLTPPSRSRVRSEKGVTERKGGDKVKYLHKLDQLSNGTRRLGYYGRGNRWLKRRVYKTESKIPC